MKEKRKHGVNKYAVSAVTAVILMAAIAVAMAAVAYLYINGMMPGVTKATPYVSLYQPGNSNYLIVTSVENGPIYTTGFTIRFVDGTGSTVCDGTLQDNNGDDKVSDGDIITPNASITGTYTVTLIYNSDVVGQAKFVK